MPNAEHGIAPLSKTGMVIFRAALACVVSLILFTLATLLEFSNFAAVYAVFLLAITSILNPRYPLYFLFFILPFFGNNPGGKYALFFVDQVLMILVLRWLIPLLFTKKPRIRGCSFGVFLWLFFLSTLFSLIPLRRELMNAFLSVGSFKWCFNRVYTAYAVDLFWSVRMVADLFLSLLYLYFFINNVREKGQLKTLALATLSGFFLAIVLGILDFHKVVDLSFFRPLNPDIQRFGYSRLMSVFRHSGWFGEYLVLVAPFYLSLVLFGKTGRDQLGFLHRKRLLSIFGLFLILYATLFTYQRAAWISMIFMSATLLFLAFPRLARRRNAAIGIFASILITIALLLFLTSDRTSHTALSRRLRRTFFAGDRTLIWDQALLMYRKKPLLGIGAGNYYLYHRSCFPPDHPYFSTDKVTAHSTYLHILVERGPFALLLFLIILAKAGWRVWKKWIDLASNRKLTSNGRGEENRFHRILVAGILVSLSGFAVYALAQYLFYLRVIGILAWTLLAISEVAGGDLDGKRGPFLKTSPKEKITPVLFVGFLLICLGFQFNTRDLFFWNEYRNPNVRFIAAWFDPWDERSIDCREEVVEARFVAFHPDAREKPVRVDMLVNGEVAASAFARSKSVHKISALIPDGTPRPLSLRFRTDRPFFAGDAFPHLRDRKPYTCVVERDIRCRSLGLEGIHFSGWEGTKSPKYRWTTARKALCELNVRSPSLVIYLKAANPDLNENPLHASLLLRRKSGEVVASKEMTFRGGRGGIDPDTRKLTFDLSGLGNEAIRLEIQTDRLFCPLDFVDKASREKETVDTRTLGLYVSEPLWSPPLQDK